MLLFHDPARRGERGSCRRVSPVGSDGTGDRPARRTTVPSSPPVGLGSGSRTEPLSLASLFLLGSTRSVALFLVSKLRGRSTSMRAGGSRGASWFPSGGAVPRRDRGGRPSSDRIDNHVRPFRRVCHPGRPAAWCRIHGRGSVRRRPPGAAPVVEAEFRRRSLFAYADERDGIVKKESPGSLKEGSFFQT